MLARSKKKVKWERRRATEGKKGERKSENRRDQERPVKKSEKKSDTTITKANS